MRVLAALTLGSFGTGGDIDFPVGAPVLTSVNLPIGDRAGGVTIILAGTGFTGTTGVTLGGTACTSVVVDSDIQVTCVTPAKALGTYDIVLTTGAGSDTLVSAYEAWDPSALGVTGWWRGDFAESPWVGEVGGNLAEATNPPATGTAQNGRVPASFDGTNDLLQHANDWSTFVKASAGTVLVVFYADSAATAAGNTYDDPALVSDEINGFNLGFSTGGIGLAYYDSGWVSIARISCGTGAYHIAKVRWDGVNAGLGLDAAAYAGTAAGALSFFGGAKLTLGKVAISATKFFNGRILDIVVDDAKISDADDAKFRAYVNTRYGLSL